MPPAREPAALIWYHHYSRGASHVQWCKGWVAYIVPPEYAGGVSVLARRVGWTQDDDGLVHEHNYNQRSLRAKAAAHAMHAQYDPHQTTAAAHAALWRKYEAQANPDERLDPEERRRRARHLMHADLARSRLAKLKQQREAREAAADAMLAQQLAEVAQ
jgi:hypothetical protein